MNDLHRSIVTGLAIIAAVVPARAAIPDSEPAPTPNRLPQGGGVIYPSWRAQYWANPKLEGKPAWEKMENRIRFDWQDWRPVLGIKAESVCDFPTDNFSVRFTGTIVARFGEEYTLRLTSDEGARMKIRPQGAAAWQTIIDAWAPHKRQTDTARIRLDAGGKYDVELEYFDLEGDAVCELRWSSASTPDEVLDYAAANTYREIWPYMQADVASPRNEKFPEDENGWPTSDSAWTLTGGYPFYPGRFLLRFDGQAEVKKPGAKFVAGGETFDGVLPGGKGYDAARNQTTAFMDLVPDQDGCARGPIAFAKTRRTPQAPEGSGVTRVQVMKPKTAGGKETHEPGEIVCGEAKEAFLPIYAFRVQRTGLSEAVEWKERTRPDYSQNSEQHSHNQFCYEKLALAANEMGRDLHLNFGGSVNYEFMDKIAKLFLYGSDGENPYDKPTRNPEWPPLNPNLRLYLEHGNEMGWSAIQPRDWHKDYQRIRQSKQEPEWSVLNFDGKAEREEYAGLMRYHAYRTVRMSQAMRSVWGDAAMGEKVRVLIFGQYVRSFQNDFPQFIDDYYNNGAGQFVKDPHPASYYLWGAGGAIYYSTSNPWAAGKTPILSNHSFEDYPIEAGKAAVAPRGAGWALEGTAGVVDVRYPRHVAFEPGAANGERELVAETTVGTRFTVGARDIHAYEVGRFVRAGESGKRTVEIYTAEGDAVAPTRAVMVELKAGKAGEAVFAPLEYTLWAPAADASRVGLWRLEAGKSYVVVSAEPAGRLPQPVELKPGPGITIDGAVQVTGGKLGSKDSGGKVEVVSKEGTGFPLATFRYTDQVLAPAPGLALVPPDPSVDPAYAKGGKGASLIPESHRTGCKMAFIAGRGRISQTFRIEEAGDYALVFSGAAGFRESDARAGSPNDNPLTIRIDGQAVWDNQAVGGPRKPKHALYQYGTRYVTLQPGEHMVSIEGTSDDPAATVYIDAAHIGSMLDMAGGPAAANFLGAGTATSGTDDPFEVSAKGMAAMAQIWGLVPYCYEGGTNPGGDWNGGGVLYAFQFKENHPLSKVADSQWARLWHRAGGANAMFYYDGFPEKYIHNAEDYVQWQAAIERAHGWQLEPTEGVKLPATLTCAMPHFQGEPASGWKSFVAPWQGWNKPNPRGPEVQAQQWKAWVVNAPEAREYEIGLAAAGEGTARLSVNDSQILAAGPAAGELGGKVWLNKGTHSIKVKCVQGAFTVKEVAVR